MMHTIRLRKPWKRISLGDDTESRVDVPDLTPVSPSGDAVGLIYERRFNLPTGLETNSRVRITVSRWRGVLQNITVNDREVSAEASGTWDPPGLDLDVSSLLRPHNTLRLMLAGSGDATALLDGEVSLVIED